MDPLLELLVAQGLTEAEARAYLEAHPITVQLAESDRSHDEIRQAVAAALNDNRAAGSRVWPSEVYDSYVIYQEELGDGVHYWRRAYAIDEDGTVTLGDPVAVEKRTSYQKIGETTPPGEVVLLEAVAGQRNVFDVLLIGAGTSKNRRRYRPAVLKEAVPLFDGVRAYAASGPDHNPSERGVKSLVGWYTNPRYVTGIKSGKGLREGVAAHFHVAKPAQWLADLMGDALERGKPDLVGFSIVGDGETVVVREARTKQPIQDVVRISSIESVDPVTNPAAGGVALRLVASKEDPSMDWAKLTLAEAIKGLGTGTILPSELKENRADLAGFIEAGQFDENPAPSEKPEEKPAPVATGATPAANADGVDIDALLEAKLAPMRTQATLSAKLAERRNLPAVAVTRIREAADGKGLSETEVDALIQREVDYAASLNPAIVRDAGAANVTDMKTETERVSEAVYDILAGKSQDSIREIYISLTGDRAFTGKLQEGGRLLESISSTTFDQIMGDSITRRMVDIYRLPELGTWRQITGTPIPLRDFRTQRRIRMGGYGNLPTVAQGDPYTPLTTPSDEEATYAPTKRGGTEDLTLETIANDDLGQMRRIPVALARAAANTLHEFVFDFLRANPTIYDGVALFHATHNNLLTVALAAPALSAARLQMVKQAELGSAKRLGIQPRFLIVPADLEQTAYELTATDREVATPNNTLNFIRTWGLSVITVPYWTDVNNYFLAADPNLVPLIELGFFGPEEPELFLQDQPTVGSVFSNDKLTYKIRHIYGGAVVDFRGLQGNIVA